MKKIIIIIILLLISGFTFYKECSYDAQTVSVTGTIYGKNIEGVLTGKYHNNYETKYAFALDPDNKTYKNITVYVSFATYSSYNVGDRITFPNIFKKDVDPSFEGGNNWIILISLMICIVSISYLAALALE